MHKSIAIFLTLLAALKFTPLAFAEEGKPFRFEAPQIRTGAVQLDGKRREKKEKICGDAPPGAWLDEGAFEIKILNDDDTSERSCIPEFDVYKEISPDFFVPQRVCLNLYVKSVGGPENINKRGHLRCAIETSAYDMPGPDIKTEKSDHEKIASDVTLSIPTVPAKIELHGQSASYFKIIIPMNLVKRKIDLSLQSSEKIIPGFKVTLKGSRLVDVLESNRRLGIYLDFDVSGPLNVRCGVTTYFSIIGPRFPDAKVKLFGTESNCRTGSAGGNLLGIPEKLNQAIISTLTPALSSGIIADSDGYKKLLSADLSLLEFYRKAYVQGSYCGVTGATGSICVVISWPNKEEIHKREAELLSSALPRTVPLDSEKVEKLLANLRHAAYPDHLAKVTGLDPYPAGFKDGQIEDGDMAIFGGLLCASGEQSGCALLKAASSTDGRFWRSPRHVGSPERISEATFSGDQMKGAIAYLTATAEPARTASFLTYLKSKPTSVPDSGLTLESGYSSCPNYEPKFTCFVGGFDWYALGQIAKRDAVEEALPNDFGELTERYKFTHDTLVWEALITPKGYRLHLLGVQIFLLRLLGERSAKLDGAAKILSGREPNNAFFMFLNIGADQRVLHVAQDRCFGEISRVNFGDWQWQRSEDQEAWRESMIWDCIFLFNLLHSKR